MTTNTIGATGRTYATIALWEADSPANLVSSTDTWEGEMYNDATFAHTGTISIAGITADATYNVQLRCATGESFKDTSAVALNASQSDGVYVTQSTTDSQALAISVNFTTVTGIQFEHTGTGYGRTCLDITGTDVDINDCIVKGGGGTQTARACVRLGGQSNQTMTNCLMIATDADSVVLALGYATSNPATITGCTIVCPSDVTSTANGIEIGYGTTHLLQGCAVFNFSTNFSGTFSGSSGNNCTNEASAPGSTNQVSKTFSSQFENVTDASGDYRLATGSDCEANSAQFTETSDLDIKGQARNVTTPDIGCWELQAAGGTTSLQMQNYMGMNRMSGGFRE